MGGAQQFLPTRGMSFKSLQAKGLPIMLTSMCYCQAHGKFWDAFGKNLKSGCNKDTSNRKRSAPLLGLYSNKSEDYLMSIDQYMERMQENIMSVEAAHFMEDLSF